MGEIGINRKEYLYSLKYSDLICIERGYHRRTREAWSMNRWQTYHFMLATCGGKALKEAGIHDPIDLHRFLWEKKKDSGDNSSMPTKEEVEEMQALMRKINDKLQ